MQRGALVARGVAPTTRLQQEHNNDLAPTTELTVAQMQGKFRFVLLPDSVGHLVQEDCPDRVAEELSEFIIRNKFVESWKLNEKLRKLKKS